LVSWPPADIHKKFYGGRPRGTPPSGKLKHEGLPRIVILDLSKAVSWKWCKIGGKLVLITNRKLHTSFWLVPKSVTLNGVMAVILCYFSEIGSFQCALRKTG